MSTNPYQTPKTSGDDSVTGKSSSSSPIVSLARSVLGVIGGVVVAAMVVGVLESIGHLIFPPPPDVDLSDPEALKAIIDKLPTGAIVAVLVAWGAGALVGGFVSALVAGRAFVIHALIVGCIQMSFGILTMLIIPHPMWFVVAGLLIFLPASWIGGTLAAKMRRRPNGPGNPRPYDMREKNMAC